MLDIGLNRVSILLNIDILEAWFFSLAANNYICTLSSSGCRNRNTVYITPKRHATECEPRVNYLVT